MHMYVLVYLCARPLSNVVKVDCYLINPIIIITPACTGVSIESVDKLPPLQHAHTVTVVSAIIG